MAPPLKVPDTGLVLWDSSDPSTNPKLPIQAFTLTLDKLALEDMIRCVQNGDEISLSLGKLPTLNYSSTSYKIPKSETSNSHDLFFTQPFESLRKAHRVPVVSDLYTKLPKAQPKKRTTTKSEPLSPISARQRESIAPASNKSPNLNSDLEILQNSMARHEAARGNTLVLGGVPPTDIRGSKNKSQLLRAAESLNSQTDSSSGSIKSASPGVENSAHAKTQNILERNKLQRVMVVHELAVRDQATEYLREKWTGKTEDFDAALHKAAEFDSTSKTWSLAKNYWKELDVWNYDYDSKQERQEAINNAISKYDRMRLSPNQDEWQRLLPAEERGKGRCLSRIQANLMKGPMSSVKTSEDKSEAMSRSKSNPLPKPTSKKTEKEKRLPATSSAKKATVPKAPKVKASATSTATPGASSTPSSVTAAANAPKKNYPLSSEFVTSDMSDSESHASVTAASLDEPRTTSNARKPSPTASSSKPTTRDSPTKPRAAKSGASSSKLAGSPTKSLSSAKIASKVVPTKTTVVKSTKTATSKRHREDEDEDDSSSSGTPLSKRHKVKAGNGATNTTSSALASLASSKNRSSETLRFSAISSSNGIKKTGSPLARNSPAPVSEPSETQARPRVAEKSAAVKRRPIETERDAPKPSKTSSVKNKETAKELATETKDGDGRKAKRPHAPPEELINKAARFKLNYERYAKLHAQIVNTENPRKDQVDYLTDLREKLKDMKSTIYYEHLLSYNS
ncbi:hypothetical protein Cpir12675_003828 [Ceratocystis pirilliformis]|uniref:RING-type E3 ubiquitin transferase n=1 Tax=Ceratocystis pirilliformis TaxID=259994 RepID=A0ABR3Z0Q4_9PEZI